jgi:signal transduction histidine kinase
MSILLATGVARGIMMFALFDALGYQNPAPLSGRISNAIWNVALWISFGSIFIESKGRFTRSYRAALTQILILKLRSSSFSQSGYGYIADQILQMELRLGGVIEQTTSAAKDSETRQVLADALRREVHEELKPLSQQLWAKSAYNPPSLRFTSVLKTAITQLRFRFHLVAFIYSGSCVLNTIFVVGPFISIAYSSLIYLLFFVINLAREILNRVFENRNEFVNILFVLLVGFIVLTGSTFIFDLLGLINFYSAAILIAPSLSALIIAASFLELALSDRKTLIEILATESRIENEDFLAKVNRGNAASFLHNSLQSELTALALQLDAVTKNPDTLQSRIVMEKVESFISRSRSEDFKNFLETPEIRLARILDSWDGIAKIKVEIDDKIYSDPARSSLMVQLIQESVANAIRSGRANEINISGEFFDDAIGITVCDNGRASTPTGKRGMGSEWIDSIATADWTLEETENGRTLKVEI